MTASMQNALCSYYAVSNSPTVAPLATSGSFFTKEETQLSESLMQYSCYDWDVIVRKELL